VTALRTATTVETLIVEILDEDDRSGFGVRHPAKCGGPAPARTLLSLAEEHGMGMIVGSMLETPVGVSAAAGLVAAYGTTAVSDLDAAWWLAASPVRGGITYDGAMAELADAPGLGVSGVIGGNDT
jgi:L-alanine-DL-glutamate epimerase-like enolase superfamily enzyme